MLSKPYDIGHESLRQGLNGRVRRKLACVHKRLEFVCACGGIDHVHKENQKLVCNAIMVAHIEVLSASFLCA
jgi:hypothetical protein